MRLEKDGDRIIPRPVRLATKRNTEGRIIVHRDRPREPHSWQVLWGREQFCGNGQTEWVEDFVTRTTMRYPRTQLASEDIELIRATNTEGLPYFITDFIPVENEERWRIAINLYLEIFGSCWIADRDDLDFALTVSRRVGWRILPPGRHCWSELKPEIDSIIKTMPNRAHRNRAERCLRGIIKQGPSQTIVGEGGFHGYIAFHFPERGFTVLESIHPNNATYILGQDWASISKLSKAEILENDHHLQRFIHGQDWEKEMECWFLDHAA